ncbi:MAG: Gfo/Idh/MocA family oxidoreductase [Candidatus Eisenbacteria bacterium]
MPVRIVQIGVGVRGGHWMEFIRAHPDTVTVACVDCRSEALDEARERCGEGGLACYTGIAEALEKTEADAALIATPSHLHAEHALQVLEAGLPVMTEKPLATAVRDGKRVLEKAAKAGKPVVVAENYRYWPAERTVRKIVAEGTLGKISAVTFVDYRNQPSGQLPGWVNELENPHLQEIGVHHFDSMRGLFSRNAAAVSARAWNPPWSDWKGLASTEALVEMEGGIHIQYYSSLVSPYYSFALRIEGERGDLWTNRKYVFTRSRGKRFFLPVRAVRVPPGDGAKYPRGGTTSLLNSLRDAVVSGTPAETRGEDNILSLAMVEAAWISHKEGRRVTIEEVMGRSSQPA